jgi:hypothetical protein
MIFKEGGLKVTTPLDPDGGKNICGSHKKGN